VELFDFGIAEDGSLYYACGVPKLHSTLPLCAIGHVGRRSSAYIGVAYLGCTCRDDS
jgi:hypothetical protein